jgi:putative ABC transport system ATP-binding protein
MTGAAAALIDVRDLVKDYQGLRPLRIRSLAVQAGDVIAVSGLDSVAAETLVHVITGATLPDSGEVTVFGTNTRSITDGEAWLKSLDRLGMITSRGVLIEAFTVLQNVAMSLTLDVDPIDPRVLPQAGALAREAGIDADVFDVPTGLAGAETQMRVHLARALALGPKVLIGEHPTATLPRESVAAFAADVARVARARGLGLLAITEDEVFARALGGTRLQLNGATGELTAPSFFKKLFG